MEKVKFPQKPRFPRNPRREPNQPRINVALLGCLRTRQGVWESVQWYKFLIVCGISDPRECFTCIIHVVMRQEEAEEDDESYATRQDQLNLKPVRGNKGRGRGGKGRGRGRGSTIKEKNKAGKMSDDDWWNQTWIDEWGHPDEEQFSDGYGDSGYYWDRYAWYEGAESLEQLEPETKKGKGKKTPEKKEPSGKSKVKKDKDAKSKKPAQNAKTKDEKHEGPSKVKKDKTNAMPSAGSTSKKRKPACEKAADQSSEPAKKRKPRQPRQKRTSPHHRPHDRRDL